MSVIQVNGNYFLTATDGPVNKLTLEFLGIDDREYFNPSGPNAGEDPAGSTVDVWTDTVIEITDAAIIGETLTGVSVIDVDAGFIVPFDVSPDQIVTAPPALVLTDSWHDYATGDLTVFGTGLDGASSLRVYYNGGGSFVDFDAGDPGVSFSPTTIGVYAPSASILTGESLTSIEAYELPAATNLLDTISDDVNILVQPLINSFSNANTSEIAVNGLAMDDIDRLIVQLTDGPFTIDYYDPAGPNNGLNPGSATILQWDAANIVLTDPTLIGETVVSIVLTHSASDFTAQWSAWGESFNVVPDLLIS